ncbi:uncharacterized protein LOC135809892 isoform X2 [Sycon ciliatum]|uniref:uncharacterized protein LOC135809892 isoform X2 n=1 Tax=Sycon ciliatum TaxID=27933 RepID=UPI0031F6FB7E
MRPLRIACVGPEKVGKTVLCNVLSENGLESYGEYKSTHCVRYDSKWAAIEYKCDAVLLVITSDKSLETVQRLEKICKFFIKRKPAVKVLVLKNELPGNQSIDISLPISGHEQHEVDPQEGVDALRKIFKKFINRLADKLYSEEADGE